MSWEDTKDVPGGQGVITTMMRDANRVSEVKYKSIVEQCVRHLEKKEICQVQGNEGELFLHGDRWSRGQLRQGDGEEWRRAQDEE